MDGTLTIHMKADTTEFRSAMAEISVFHDALEGPAERRREFGERLADLFDDGAAFGLKTVTAPGTSDITVVLEPSNALLGLLDVLRTGDLELCLVELGRHRDASSVGLRRPEDGATGDSPSQIS